MLIIKIKLLSIYNKNIQKRMKLNIGNIGKIKIWIKRSLNYYYYYYYEKKFRDNISRSRKNMTRVTKEARKVESTNCIFSRGG